MVRYANLFAIASLHRVGTAPSYRQQLGSAAVDRVGVAVSLTCDALDDARSVSVASSPAPQRRIHSSSPQQQNRSASAADSGNASSASVASSSGILPATAAASSSSASQLPPGAVLKLRDCHDGCVLRALERRMPLHIAQDAVSLTIRVFSEDPDASGDATQVHTAPVLFDHLCTADGDGRGAVPVTVLLKVHQSLEGAGRPKRASSAAAAAAEDAAGGGESEDAAAAAPAHVVVTVFLVQDRGSGGKPSSHGSAPLLCQQAATSDVQPLWAEMCALHHRSVEASVWGPAVLQREKQFEVAVDELVALEVQSRGELQERDATIAQLVIVAKARLLAPDDSDTDDATAAVAAETATAEATINAAVAATASILASTQPATSLQALLRAKDMELFMLRARIGAMEAARKSELDGLRDQLAALQRTRESAVRRDVSRILATKRQWVQNQQEQTAQRMQLPQRRATPGPADGGHSNGEAPPLPAAPSPRVASSRAGSASAPRRDPSPVVVSTAAASRSAADPAPRTHQPRPSRPLLGNGDAPTIAMLRGVGHDGAGAAAATAADRIRRLEESFSRLQLRHTHAAQQPTLLPVEGDLDPLGPARPQASRQSVSRSDSIGGSASPSTGAAASARAVPKQQRSMSPIVIPAVVPGLLPSAAAVSAAAAATGGRGGDGEAASRSPVRHHRVPSQERRPASSQARSGSNGAQRSGTPRTILRLSPFRLPEELTSRSRR